MPENTIRRLVQKITQENGATDASLFQSCPLERHQIPALCRQLQEAGFWVGVIDAEPVDSPGVLFSALAKTFQFPGYFGHNWDAVIDCLSDLSWLAADRTCCIVVNADALKKRDPPLFETFREVCRVVALRLLERPGRRDFKVILC